MSRSLVAASAALAIAVVGGASVASAQGNLMKACGDKWKAAKAAKTTEGQTWPQFLAKCRTAAARGASPTAAAASAPPAPTVAAPAASTKSAVFPKAVSAKFAGEKPYRARQKTCSEQYQANKATGGNAGLRWLEKGGGYWSQCNARLKQGPA